MSLPAFQQAGTWSNRSTTPPRSCRKKTKMGFGKRSHPCVQARAERSIRFVRRSPPLSTGDDLLLTRQKQTSLRSSDTSSSEIRPRLPSSAGGSSRCLTSLPPEKLSAIGNSLEIVIEKPVLDLLDIDRETELEMTTDGQRLIIEPIRQRRKRVLASAKKIMDAHDNTFRKLAK